MTLQEAVKARHSVRAYKDQPLPKDIIDALAGKIEELNKKSGLHLQLVVGEPKAFSGRLAKYGKFSGVDNYIVVAGKKGGDMGERAGYYGEQLVLFAQTLGLNTCWVGLTYSKIPGTFTLDDDEKVFCFVALGYGESQGVTHKIKTLSQVSNASETTPQWFKDGVEAALLAPTAVNQQKFSFEYKETGTGLPVVVAHKGFSLVGYTKIDLGIAKCHFEIGAGKENFTWG